MPSMRLLIELLDSASECCVYAWLSWLVILKQLVQLRVRKNWGVSGGPPIE